MIKRYRITTRPFWGTPEELNDEINIISGLVNLNLDWDRIKKENGFLVRDLVRKGCHADFRVVRGRPTTAQKPCTRRCCQAAHGHLHLT